MYTTVEPGTHWSASNLNGPLPICSGICSNGSVAAILAGADATWVNWLASIFFVARVLHFLVHYAGIGPMNFGPRTFIFVVGWACSAVLAVLAILAVF